jgi:hypothetical protein
MNDAIKQIFRLHSTEGEILVANVQFRDKVNIIRSSIAHHSVMMDDTWRKEADKVMIEILNTSSDYRNVFAHNPFFAEKDDTLVFYRSTAKKQLEFPNLRVTAEEFNDLIATCDRLQRELKRILVDLQPGAGSGLARALLGMPTIGMPPPDYAGHLLSLFPIDPSSGDDPATRQTPPRSPKEPQA